MSVLPSPVPRPCNRKIHPRRALQSIKDKNYITVEDALVGVESTLEEVLRMKPFTRKRRDVRYPRDIASGLQGASPCQWKWGSTKKRPNEIPSTLTRAICPSCGHYCKAIRYEMRVLARDGCDTSGLTIWRWKPREITIAYVYTGSS